MKFNWPMPPDTIISEEAATGMIGQQIQVILEGGVTYYATVTGTAVEDGGRALVVEAAFLAPEGEALLYAP